MRNFRKRTASLKQRMLSPPMGFQHGKRGMSNKRFPMLLWLSYWVVAHFTRRIVLFLVVGVVPAAFLLLLGFNSAFFQLSFALVSLIIVCMFVGYIRCPQLEVESCIPERVECGTQFETRYIVRNTGKRTALCIAVETLVYPDLSGFQMQQADAGDLSPGADVLTCGKGKACRRGVYSLPGLRWDTDYPCGFWRWGKTDRKIRTLVIYPGFTQLESLNIPLGSGSENELSSENKISREAFEFHGCREFREGDMLRHVHSRSSARLGKPVVKEFQSEGRERTAVLIDTLGDGRLGRVKARLFKNSSFEAGLSLTAAIIDYLSVTDRVLELLVAGPEVYRFVSSGRGGYFEDVLDILASIEPCVSDSFEQLGTMLLEEIRLVQSVCLVLTHWDQRREALVQELCAYAIGVKIILITADGYRPADVPDYTICLSAAEVLRGGVCAL
ncbi:MAG: DUF58 domain-containing protein [Kiritimatiellia bacterium]